MNSDRKRQYLNNLASQKLKDLPPENKIEMRNSRREIEIVDLPDIVDVIGMAHGEMIQVLRLCPASQFFGIPRVKLNVKSVPKKEASRLLIAMIKMHT